jgi:uncharacterized membrane protein
VTAAAAAAVLPAAAMAAAAAAMAAAAAVHRVKGQHVNRRLGAAASPVALDSERLSLFANQHINRHRSSFTALLLLLLLLLLLKPTAVLRS